jgi:hypothetical protein
MTNSALGWNFALAMWAGSSSLVASFNPSVRNNKPPKLPLRFRETGTPVGVVSQQFGHPARFDQGLSRPLGGFFTETRMYGEFSWWN